MCKRKTGKISYVSNALKKLNADPDEIDNSSADSDLEDSDHIEAIEDENPQISLLLHSRCQTSYWILLAPLPIQKCSVSWPLLLKSYKTWDYNAGNKLRLKLFLYKTFNVYIWFIRFLYSKNCFLYSLHISLPLLLTDNSQKSHISKSNAWRTKDLSAGPGTYKNMITG